SQREGIADLVEVDAIEDVGSLGDHVNPQAAVTVDEEGLGKPHVSGGIDCAAIGVARGAKGHGKVVIQSLAVDLVDEARGADGERQPALQGHNWSKGDVGQGAVQEVPLVRPKGSGIDRVGYENMGDVKHRHS